jgi:hypothetical protein
MSLYKTSCIVPICVPKHNSLCVCTTVCACVCACHALDTHVKTQQFPDLSSVQMEDSGTQQVQAIPKKKGKRGRPSQDARKPGAVDYRLSGVVPVGKRGRPKGSKAAPSAKRGKQQPKEVCCKYTRSNTYGYVHVHVDTQTVPIRGHIHWNTRRAYLCHSVHAWTVTERDFFVSDA